MPEGAFVYFDLAKHPAILAIQKQVRKIVGEAEYQDPATFHITALYINDIGEDDLNAIMAAAKSAGLRPFTTITTRLDVFENNDERALHMVVEPVGLIAHVQADLYRRFVTAGFEAEMSPYSSPAQYRPHITLAYLPPDVPVPDLTFNLEIEVSRLVFGRDDYKAVGAVPKGFAMTQSDSNKMLWRPTQAEVQYTPLSGNPLQLCSGCRWFVGGNDGGPYCHLIESWPADIMATGHCDRWEAPPQVDWAPDPMPVVIVDSDDVEMAHDSDNTPAKSADKLAATTEAVTPAQSQESAEPAVTDAAKSADKTHDHPVTTQGYIAPASNAPGIFKSLVNRFTGGIKPGTSVMKAADGKRMMFIITSNSYQDRATQWITSQALTDDVKRHWAGDDTAYLGGIQHLFWHWKELGPVGEIVYSDVWGPFLVEVSRETDDPVSYAFYTFVENHPEIDWGASQHFLAFKSQNIPNGTFTRILRDEATTLPREDAANLLTFTGVIPMASKRQEYLNNMMKEAYGIDDAAGLLEKGLDTLKAEIAKTGGVHKAAGTQPEPSVDFAPLVLKLVEDVADVSQALDEIKLSVSGVTDKTKSLEETQIGSLTKTVEGLVDQVKSIADELKLKPRSARDEAGGDENTLLTAEQVKALRDQTPMDGAKRDTFFGDMDIPAATS